MYPNLIGKKYINIASGQSSLITEQDGDIVTLDSSDKVSILRILDKNVYDDFIDPVTFLSQSSYSILSDKIKSVPDEVINNMKSDDEPSNNILNESVGSDYGKEFYANSNESMIINVDPEEEMKMMLEKASKMAGGNNINAAQIQHEQLMALVNDEEGVKNEVVESRSQHRREAPIPTPTVVHVHREVTEDPIITMFKGVKRNLAFSIDLKISELIPRVDFIEMMEDSYNTSIIDYLASEFTEKILNDPESIKSIIKNKIKECVYGEIEFKEKTIEKKPVTKQPVKRIVKKTAKESVSDKKNKENI